MTPPKLSPRELLTLFALLLLGQVDSQILSPILPQIASSFGVTVARVGASVAGYSLAAAAIALVVGPLSDRHGRRRYLLVSATAYALASAAVVWAPSFVLFVVARVAAGAAGGVASALVVAFIADRVAYERRGGAMAWVAGAYSIAPILGVPLGSWLAGAWGWRAIYGVFFVVASVAGAGLWVFVHEASTSPVVPSPVRAFNRYVQFMKERPTAMGAWSAFFVSGGITGFITYLGAYLQSRFGLTLGGVGVVFLVSGAFSVAGAVASGRLSDRWGKRSFAVAGSLALAAAISGVPHVPFGESFYVVLAVVALAASSRVAPLQSLVTELVSRERRGAFIALRNTLSQLGIAFAATVGAALYQTRGFEAVCYFTVVLNVIAAGILMLLAEPSAESVGEAEVAP